MRLFVIGQASREEEQELLGEHFVMDGQQVRVLRGEHEGRLGVVVDPAVLCEENERGQVMKRPQVDARGQAPVEDLEEVAPRVRRLRAGVLGQRQVLAR